MVGRELLRVAILWHELWHGALDEASRRFYIDKNPDAMIATLEPLYEIMDAVRTITFLIPKSVNMGYLGSDNCSRDILCSDIWK